ncbi:Ankyrin repeat-containing protein, partial [Brazilian cedratvirus IHUMI]
LRNNDKYDYIKESNERIMCSRLAKAGHLETLKWVREKGWSWDESTPIFAASGGHLEILKWCKEQGCPLTFLPLLARAAT